MALMGAKTAAQLKPGATTQTALYTVPSSTEFVGALVVCNMSTTTQDAIRARVKIGGAGDADEQFFAYGMVVDPGQTVSISPVNVTATDVVAVYSTTGTSTFQLMGVERT